MPLAGQIVMHANAVCVRVVKHGTQNCVTVRLLGQARQIFAEADAGYFGLCGAILAANAVGRVRLWIERLVLRRPAGLENEHDRLGAPGTRRRRGLGL